MLGAGAVPAGMAHTCHRSALNLHCTCLQEKTELEEQRRALQEEVVRYRAKIRQLEHDLLFRLSNSQACCSPFVATRVMFCILACKCLPRTGSWSTTCLSACPTPRHAA